MTVELQGHGTYVAMPGSTVVVEMYTGLAAATRTLVGQWVAPADGDGYWSIGNLPSCEGPFAGYYFEITIPQASGIVTRRGPALSGVWAMTSLVDPGVTGPSGGEISVTNAELGTGTADNTHLLRGDRAWAAYGTPGASAVGDSAAAGTATTPVRSDHVHGREAFGTISAQTSFGGASANGTAATPARSDHTHGTPANPVTSALALVTQNTNTVATSGAAQTVPDVTADTVSAITLTANCTFTFPTAAAGNAFSLALVQGGIGSFTATWPAAVKWPSGTAPTLTTTVGKADLFSFLCVDGTNWLAHTVGLNF